MLPQNEFAAEGGKLYDAVKGVMTNGTHSEKFESTIVTFHSITLGADL